VDVVGVSLLDETQVEVRSGAQAQQAAKDLHADVAWSATITMKASKRRHLGFGVFVDI
jgi:hypothetical protein